MHTLHHRIALAAILLPLATAALAQAPAGTAGAAANPATAKQDSEWPQVTTVNGTSYTLNQPSFTGLSGNTVTLKSALQVKPNVGDPKVGTVTMSSTMAPADVGGLVEIGNFTVTGIDGIGDSSVSATLTRQLQGMAFTVPLATVVQDIAIDASRNDTGLTNPTPAIVVTHEPTVLVSVSGNPVLAPLGATGWQRVSNTPFILLKSPQGTWFVRLGRSTWQSAAALDGRFGRADAPPAAVIAAIGNPPATPSAVNQDIERIGGPEVDPPIAIVATTPTVLVSINGPTQTRDVGPGLKTVTNTRQTVLLRDQAPKYWVLASGRWFSANAEGGPWMYVPGNELPEEFQQISETDGKIGSALASVPGTKAAKEAVVNNGLVRTVVLDRGKTQCDVKWNGQPAFTAINGTKLQYATNASQPVIKDGSAFYCCDSAAWFKASSASGPWSLCDNVPAEIYAIPASCPVYPVTFVEVYGSTADSVTFGFTAGYVGSYVQDGSIVYGTGYNYATLANDDGSSQTYPQTYGNQANYDQDSGIWAPPSGDAYADYYPAVYPAVYEGGWGGWGWYPGYATAWGYGYGHWGTWNNWNHYWNNWHPYYNHWNNGWHEWQRNDFNRHNLANQADANRNFRNTAGGWNSYAASRAEANTWNRANGVVQVNPNREEAREQRQVLGPNMNADTRRDFGYHPTGFHPANQNVRRPGGNGAAHPAPAYHGGGAARGGGGGGRR